MVRRYQELIEVRAGGDVSDTDVQSSSPSAFLWRGRLYIVRDVIAHWRERRAWWRDALDLDEEEGNARPEMSATYGLDCLEHEVWRVEASSGRLAGTGVYDLGQDGGPGMDGVARGWRLLRVAD
jgi:hypothetical protein